MTISRISLFATLSLAGISIVSAQTGHSVHHGMKPTMAHRSQSGSMMAECASMMKMHEQMKMDMSAMDTKLGDMVAAMKSASGDQKLDAISAVVEELANESRGMHMHMMPMQDKMMGHMMMHMKSGTMANCPMMKGMPGMSGKKAMAKGTGSPSN